MRAFPALVGRPPGVILKRGGWARQIICVSRKLQPHFPEGLPPHSFPWGVSPHGTKVASLGRVVWESGPNRTSPSAGTRAGAGSLSLSLASLAFLGCWGEDRVGGGAGGALLNWGKG